MDHHGVSVGPPRRPSPDRTNSTISSLTTQPLYRDDAWVTTNDSRCCSDSKRVDGLGGVERAPFEPLRTARLFPDAIAWTSRFHRRVVRQDAAHAATEIVAHLRVFAERRGCKACHKHITQPRTSSAPGRGSPTVRRPRPMDVRSSDGRALVRRPSPRPRAPILRPRVRGRRPRGRRPRPEGAEGAEGATDPPQAATRCLTPFKLTSLHELSGVARTTPPRCPVASLE